MRIDRHGGGAGRDIATCEQDRLLRLREEPAITYDQDEAVRQLVDADVRPDAWADDQLAVKQDHTADVAARIPGAREIDHRGGARSTRLAEGKPAAGRERDLVAR